MTSAGLRALAIRCETESSTLTVAATAVVGPPEADSSAAAVAAIDASAVAAGTKFSTWTSALSDVLDAAAGNYGGQDQASAADLANQVV